MMSSSVERRIELGAGAFLRPIVEDDVTEQYVEGLNDPEVHRFLVGPRRDRQTAASVREFVRMNREDPAAILFGLFVGDMLRGTARLHDIGEEGAFLGLAIFDKSLWGQGWGTRIVEGVTRFALGELGIARVRAIIEDDNVGSQRAFQRAGYRHDASADKVEEGQVKQLWESQSIPRG